MTDVTTTTRGDRVGYDRYGSGPGLVFIAGAGPFRAVDPITTETAQRVADLGVTAVVFDRLGRGDSAADGVLDLDRELDAIAAAIEVAGGRAVLCGHSSGCSLALRAAAAGLPVNGLALWEAPVATGADETRAWSDEIERLIDAGDTEGAQRHYMKDMPPEWLAGAEASPEWPLIAAGVVSTRADAQSLAWATAELATGSLAGIEVPVLAMYGTETFDEMPVGARMIVAAVPDGVEKEMPGAMHSWEPAPMAAELAAFVTSVAAPATA
ncbi:alpha/beta hydrolase [Microlunatus aurantiacus]|uniref:Alpha/beta hydrolase n=1 Tax=Microlunatus aurantiacus TaxID=446786 RepID=A0ABP7DIU6_9ACTN